MMRPSQAMKEMLKQLRMPAMRMMGSMMRDISSIYGSRSKKGANSKR